MQAASAPRAAEIHGEASAGLKHSTRALVCRRAQTGCTAVHTNCGRATPDHISHTLQLKQHHVAAMLMLQRTRSRMPTPTRTSRDNAPPCG